MICPHCHQPVEAGTQVCPACGHALTPEPAASPSALPCPVCGKPVEISASTPQFFSCPHCHSRLHLLRTSIGISLDRAGEPPATGQQAPLPPPISEESAEAMGQQTSQQTMQNLKSQAEEQLQTLLMQIQRSQSQIRMLEQEPKSEQRDRTLADARRQLARLDKQYSTLYDELHPAAPNTPVAVRRDGSRLLRAFGFAAILLILLVVLVFLFFVLSRMGLGFLPGSDVTETPLVQAPAATATSTVQPTASVTRTPLPQPTAVAVVPHSGLTPSDFQVTLDTGTAVQPGQVATLKVRITNNGATDADNMQIVFTGDLFDAFDLRGVQPIVRRDYLERDGRHFDFGPLASGQTIIYTFQLIARRDHSPTLWNLSVYYGQINRINSYQSPGLTIAGATPTPQPVSTIVDVPSVLGKPVAEIENLYGKGFDILPLQIGDPIVPDGGEARTYRQGKYTLYIFYNKAGIARGMQMVRGLEEDNISLGNWNSLLARFGLGVYQSPERETTDARYWDNFNGYRIAILAAKPNGPVWSVQIALTR